MKDSMGRYDETVVIYFSKEEFEKIQLVKQKIWNTSDAAVLRLLLRNALYELKDKDSLDVRIDLTKDYDREVSAMRVVPLQPDEYELFDRLYRKTGFTKTLFAKILAMPQAEKIINGGSIEINV